MHKTVTLKLEVKWRLNPSQVGDIIRFITDDLVKECADDHQAFVEVAEVGIDGTAVVDLSQKKSVMPSSGWRVITPQREWVTDDSEVAHAVIDGLRAFGVRARIVEA